MSLQPELFSNDDDLTSEIIRKHVNTVALMPRERRITLLARRSYNVLLHVAQRQSDQEIYSAPLHEIINLSGFDSQNYELLKKTLKQLMTTIVEWQSPTAGEFEVWEASALLAGCKLIKHKQTRAITIEWSYAPQLRQQLMSPERYAQIPLDVITKLRSHSAMALYEICVRYIDNPRHLTARQHWHWWRPVLTGQPEDPASKPEYRYFKRDVLAGAIAEINALTDIEVRGPIEYKGADNKTIGQIQFEVHRRDQQAIAKSDFRKLQPVDLPLIGRAIKDGVRQEDAERLLEDFGATALASALDALEKRAALPMDKFEPVLNPGRWLRAMLPTLIKGQVNQTEKKAAATKEEAKTLAPKRHARWLDEWLRRERELLKQEFLEISEESRARWLTEFRQYLVEKKTVLVKRYDTSGWAHQMIVADFLHYYAGKTRGDGWDKPTSEQLLELAAEVGG